MTDLHSSCKNCINYCDDHCLELSYCCIMGTILWPCGFVEGCCQCKDDRRTYRHKKVALKPGVAYFEFCTWEEPENWPICSRDCGSLFHWKRCRSSEQIKPTKQEMK